MMRENQPRPQGLLPFQYGGAILESKEDPGDVAWTLDFVQISDSGEILTANLVNKS